MFRNILFLVIHLSVSLSPLMCFIAKPNVWHVFIISENIFSGTRMILIDTGKISSVKVLISNVSYHCKRDLTAISDFWKSSNCWPIEDPLTQQKHCIQHHSAELYNSYSYMAALVMYSGLVCPAVGYAFCFAWFRTQQMSNTKPSENKFLCEDLTVQWHGKQSGSSAWLHSWRYSICF